MYRLRLLGFLAILALLFSGGQACAMPLAPQTESSKSADKVDRAWQTAGTFVEIPSVSFSLSEVRLPSLCGSLSPGLDSLALLQSPLLPAPANDLAARLQCRQRLLFPSHYFW